MLRVNEIGSADTFRQRLRFDGGGNQVNVILHQAIPLDWQPVFSGLPGEDLEIQSVVVISEEDILPVVAALRDVVGYIGKHDSGYSGHERRLTQLTIKRNNR